MQTTKNKTTVRTYLEEVWNQRKLQDTERFISSDYDSGVAPERGPRIASQLVSSFMAAFPDFQVKIHDIFAEADRVVVRYNFCGTHMGEWMGSPPTQRKISVDGITIYRLEDNKISQTWFSYDTLNLKLQIST